jgi:hypothetical protein
MGNSRSRDAIHESFLKKGFLNKEGGDHWRYVYFSSVGKRTVVRTKISADRNINISPTR